ncbi:bifunctional isocitrate dehydrogenase kinase/phosphatase [Agarivorans sp. Z349TD_8]|uniref:bifunctional isocitrate dehydrogenase kinase/phosphatase n=1 Tax=Agarivorans sp. Z349TD_8 TaxID=3421434 RepID=UPI003D7E763F
MKNSMEHIAAETMLQRFNSFYQCFLEVTRGAKQRFETADWMSVQLASRERIRLYDHHVTEARAAIKQLTGHLQRSAQFCAAVKYRYSQLISQHENFEVAESFFNSVYQRLFHHRYIEEDQLFIRPSRSSKRFDYQLLTHRYQHTELQQLLVDLFKDYDFAIPYEDLSRDINFIQQRLQQQPQLKQQPLHRITMLQPVFYRNKAAYLIGHYQSEALSFPIVFPLLNQQAQVAVDTVLIDSDQVSIIFGFARAYFMVDAPAPRRIVNFLKQLLPNKTDYELFTAIGCQKHAKTEFYRHYLNHLHNSKDQFELAPGIKGMVMSVFTLPSYDVVFKVIKDRFTPPKEVSRAVVKEKYRLVKQHDRVGRMADTQEFTNFEFPLARFSPELLAELELVAPSALKIENDVLTIKHLYTERKMVPLNIYLEQADETQTRQVIDEYGNAIKQLAAANIFPGDMLFKNFGVTRHGRVVFYDYDEISYMTECNFREFPQSPYPEDQWAVHPSYSVGPNDIFPEEFATFLLGKPAVKQAFRELHAELFQASYWQSLQRNIENGQFEDVFPYRRHCRFINR